MVYLIGIRVAQESGVIFFEGTRKECFLEILKKEADSEPLVIATDELGNYEKFLRFLGIDFFRVSGGPNAQFYDSMQDYEDDVERIIGYDRFLAQMAVGYAESRKASGSHDAQEVEKGEM